jgi:hypothetical protein
MAPNYAYQRVSLSIRIVQLRSWLLVAVCTFWQFSNQHILLNHPSSYDELQLPFNSSGDANIHKPCPTNTEEPPPQQEKKNYYSVASSL